jgi:hypothetical protein
VGASFLDGRGVSFLSAISGVNTFGFDAFTLGATFTEENGFVGLLTIAPFFLEATFGGGGVGVFL